MSVRARIAVLKFVRLGLLALALMVTGGSILASPRDDGSASANPDRGLYVFQAYCVGCHGETGNGDGPVAAKLFRDFGVRPTDLSSAWFQESNTDLDLQRIIKGGSKAGHRTDFMPAWGGALTDRQVEDLVAYLRELTPKAGEVAAAMISVSDELELGRVLYTVR